MCGSKCRGEGGGIFPTLCVECCLILSYNVHVIHLCCIYHRYKDFFYTRLRLAFGELIFLFVLVRRLEYPYNGVCNASIFCSGR